MAISATTRHSPNVTSPISAEGQQGQAADLRARARKQGARLDADATTSRQRARPMGRGSEMARALVNHCLKGDGERRDNGCDWARLPSGEGTGIGEPVSQRGSTAKEQGLRLGPIANVKRCGKGTDIGESVSERGWTGTEGEGTRVAAGPKCQREEERERHGHWRVSGPEGMEGEGARAATGPDGQREDEWKRHRHW